MATEFINLSAIAFDLGVTVEELKEKLEIDTSIPKDELAGMLKEQFGRQTRDVFETFCQLAGHHTETISL